jgi:hypothetical protein
MSKSLGFLRGIFSAETAIFSFFWIAFALGGRDRFFWDPGSLWHITVGDQILRSHSLPTVDSFSFTRAGSPWIADFWLSNCFLAILHRIGGFDTILVVTATILATLFTWLANRYLRSGVKPLMSVMLTALAMMASTYHLHPRPHLATIVFLAWTFAWLCDFEAGRLGLGRLFWLGLVFVVWTNMHGGVLGGMATVALAGAGWIVIGARGEGRGTREERSGLSGVETGDGRKGSVVGGQGSGPVNDEVERMKDEPNAQDASSFILQN